VSNHVGHTSTRPVRLFCEHALDNKAPDNPFLFSRQSDSTLRNSSIPGLQGSVMTTSATGVTSLRFQDGTVYTFTAFGLFASQLTSITDRNGNAIALTAVTLNGRLRITQITDPVGRSLNLTYDSNAHLTSVTDPIGRTVSSPTTRAERWQALRTLLAASRSISTIRRTA
jgi:YD repeat-containing protein